MFRKKNVPGVGAPADDKDDTAFVVPDPTPPKAPSTRNAQVTTRPPGGPGFHPDIPHRSQDTSGAPTRPEANPPAREGKPMANTVDKNTLIVGEDIRLKGEITSCDKLVVEGHVEVSLTNGRQIEIGPSGVFTGKAEVQEADISGRFDGELTARERLVVRSTGHITGKIRYGRIVIEAGGAIVGAVEAMVGAEAPKSASEGVSKAPDQAGTPSAKKDAPELEIMSQQE